MRIPKKLHHLAEKEIKNLTALDGCSKVFRYYGWEEDDRYIYIALEAYTCRLSELYKVHSLPSQPQVTKKIMRYIVQGFAQMHRKGVSFADLETKHVLICEAEDNSLHARLTGACMRLPRGTSSSGHRATESGSSRQALEQELSSCDCSINAFNLGGLIFFCITSGAIAFAGDMLEQSMDEHFNFVENFHSAPKAGHLLRQLWSTYTERRPTAAKVLNHPFFWSPELRVSFLQDTSDKLELVAHEGTMPDLLSSIESIVCVMPARGWHGFGSTVDQRWELSQKVRLSFSAASSSINKKQVGPLFWNFWRRSRLRLG